MLYYSFFLKKFPRFYSLHFFSHNLFGGRLFFIYIKRLDVVFMNKWYFGEINHSYKILKNKTNIKISYFWDFFLDPKSNQI